MSQPLNFGPDQADPLGSPLIHKDQLLKLFRDTERPKERWLIGIEYEMFGQIHEYTSPIPYEGEVSIISLFQYLLKTSATSPDPLAPLFEGQNMVGLMGKRAMIALEPGGQIEVAAHPHHNLWDATKIFSDVVLELQDAADELGIKLFAVGIHPLAGRNDMAKVKKARYGIMRNHMRGLGLDMMTRSCAIQINLDFENEPDMARKGRLAAILVPFYALMCASSAFVDGKPCDYAIERGHVWRYTDPERTGIPSIIFDNNFGYSAWIDYVLNVPMYFIRRNQNYEDVAGSSFRDFMAHGLHGHQARVRDFVDHMSTVFTEIRFKPILELRSADSLPVPFANALLALSWAIFYHERTQDECFRIFDNLTHKELVDLHNDVIDNGREAQFRGKKVLKVTKQLLTIAQQALDELAVTSKKEFIRDLLKPLSILVDKNITCAEWMREHFSNLNKKTLPDLIKNFAPFNNPLA